MRKLLGYLAITLLLAVGIVCALIYIRSGGDTLSGPVWRGGEIRVGYSSEPPYAFRRDDGSVTGEAPEIAKAVLAAIGVDRIRWVLLDFNGIFITPERSAKVLFSLPFSHARQGLLVRRDNPLRLVSYEDLAARPSVTVAVLDGSVEQLALLRLGMPEERLFVVPDPAGGLAAVRSGRADCLALSEPTVSWLAGETSGDVEVAQPFYESSNAAAGQSGFAFRPGDRELADRVNAALRRYIGTPEHLETVTPFGFGAGSLPQWSR
jgi:polar amino acid transport system substrate-binding protein